MIERLTRERTDLRYVQARETVYKRPPTGGKIAEFRMDDILKAKDRVTLQALNGVAKEKMNGNLPEKFSMDFTLTVDESFCEEVNALNVDALAVIYTQEAVEIGVKIPIEVKL